MSEPTGHQDSAKIRQLRERRGLTVDQLAARIESVTGTSVHPQSIRKIERGYHAVSLDMLIKVADGLGVEVADILKPRTPLGGNGDGSEAA